MTIEDPSERYARRGLWALPAWAALLFIGTLSHQPAPQTDLPDWARYVTTTEFLVSHLAASILGAGIGILGMVALAVVLAKGSVRLAISGLVTGVIGNTLVTSLFGVAAFAQPAIGRVYLAGRAGEAQALYYDAAQGTPLVVAGLLGALLLAVSIVLFGVAVARSGWLPRFAGVGFAVSGPLFAVVGVVLNNFVETIATALMIVSAVGIALGARPGRTPAAPASSPRSTSTAP
jgi:hypothetical protein